ncbi:ABC transporter ATP-binding protein [Anaerococcus nagyae]|uniref:ABC transporter ATP-binding protein n=1 Tax=Anaerococcus nagyae TaxID=1755241 RepID=UPI003736CB74
MNNIEIKNLNLKLGNNDILNNISFDIIAGKITGFIGNNGAGKTSLIKCLTSFYRNYDGSININNQDLKTIHISYITDSPVYYEELTFGEHIEFISAINESKELIDYYIDLFEVRRYLNHFPSELSKGTLQKMMIILALLRNKELLIADEPFTGLDPSQVDVFKEELIRLRNEGSAILISSHQLDLIDQICDNFIFIKEGKIVHNYYKSSKDTDSYHLYKKYFGK